MTPTRYLSSPLGRLPLRVIITNLALLLTMLTLLTLAIRLGSLALTSRDVWLAFAHFFTPNNHDSNIVTIVTQWRAPRAIMALLLGAGLGVSGAIFQSITRNPLGSPDIVGFNTGAYTGALVTIILFDSGYYRVASGAMLGGIATAAVIYLLAWRQGISGFRLIIIGIAISAILAAFNTWLKITGSLDSVMTAALWAAGTLNGMTWAKAQPALSLIPVTILATLLLGRRLHLLEMGDDSARALGVNAEASRLWLMLCGILLTAVATACAGPISFIALAAPQIARRLIKASATPLLCSALVGAVLLIMADIIAQHSFSAIQLPVGAVTVSLGGLYLIGLLIQEARR